MRAVVIMILFLLVLLLAPTGATVPVVTIDSETAGLCMSESNVTSLGLEMDSNNMTICGLLRPHRPLEEDSQKLVFYYNVNDTRLVIGVNSSKLWAKIGNETVIFNGSLKTNIWNTFCILLGEERWAIVNGERLLESEDRADEIRVMQKKTGLCFGSPMRYPPSVPASLAAFSIHKGLENSLLNYTSEDLPENTITCLALTSSSNILPVKSSWFGRSDMAVVGYREEELCSQSSQNFLVRQVASYYESESKCKAFGGSLLTKDEVLQGLVDMSDISLRNCLTDEVHVAWISTAGAVAEDLTAECSTLTSNGGVGSRPCVSELECSLCRIPEWLRFTLYGDIDLFDRYYFLKPSPEGGFLFEGMDTSNITREGDDWLLRSHLHQRSWRLPQLANPVGRQAWSSNSGNRTLTLTSCSLLQFSTDDGSCVSRSKRCNSRLDAPDGSDEWQCKERLVLKSKDYDTDKGYYQSPEEKGILYYNFHVFYVSYIKTVDLAATVDFLLVLRWTDPLIQFWDLRKNIWNAFPCDNVWYPKIGLMAGYGMGHEANVKSYTRRCYVYKDSETFEEYDITDPYMGRVVKGGSVNITMSDEMVATYPCLFKVYQFPFGTYKCNSTFYTKQVDPFLKFNSENRDYLIKYAGDHNLLDFMLQNITQEAFRDSIYISFTLHLESQYNYHLLNSFAPSALMFCICYATLSFPLKDFNERIMVSLTAMLVLAALFAQASDSYVKTSYFKLIDIWYAVLICLCFFIVIANIIVNRIRLMSPRQIVISDNCATRFRKLFLQPCARRVNALCAIVILLAFLITVLLFVLSATSVM